MASFPRSSSSPLPLAEPPALSDRPPVAVLAPPTSALAPSSPPRSPPASTTVPLPPPNDPPPPPSRIFKRRPPAPAPKSILKAPVTAPSRFSFRRDILQPFNSRLAYAVPASSSPLGAGVGEAIKSVAQAPAAAAGGFWGAMKRIGVAAGAPPMRDLGEEGETGTKAEEGAISSSGPAPHTPSRGLPAVGTAVGSPYATVRSTGSAVPTTTTVVQQPVQTLSVTELKKVRFRMATLKVVYPINGPNGPLAPWEEGRTKKRVNTEYRAQRHALLDGGEAKGWTGESLGRLYAECCRTREEPGIERVRRALRENPTTPPKVFDLSNELLSHGAIEALSDLLSVDFGLKKLVLESCGLDDESLKPLLHALLVSESVPTLSLANNKRIRAKGWKLIAIFTRKAKFLRYLDLSENTIDKRAADHLVQAITISPSSSGPSNESSTLPNFPSDTSPLASSPEPATASSKSPIAVDDSGADVEEEDEPPMWREDEFYENGDDDPEPLFTVAPLLREDPSSAAGTVLSIRLENCGLKGAALDALAHGVRASHLKHISIRRNRISPLGAVALAIMIRDYPIASDHSLSTDLAALHTQPPPSNGAFEPGNSVTARQALQAPYVRKSGTGSPRSGSPVSAGEGEEGMGAAAQAERDAWRNSEARTKLRKQIDELPRTGSLLTLDVKSNDIRNGVVYIAQVLKRNRTLKVLNLSENKIDVQGLVSIAEALKFNATLETLDMSFNPCCGPTLEGITTLRAAITINSNLKRIFLNGTDLSSEGAIALAEFLPEAKSLIHLDLTGNFDIDIAGVLALSVSVKMNNTLRCLDLNIPPNDPDFARLSQEILQCCVRNTEMAQEESIARGHKTTIAAPILKSVVARDLKTRQEQEERRSLRDAAASRSKDEILTAAEECREVLSEILVSDEAAAARGVLVAPSEVVRDLLVQAQLAEAQLAEAVAATRPGEQKDRAVDLGDKLTAILDRAKRLYDRDPASSPPEPNPTPPPPNGIRNLSIPTSPVGHSLEEHVSSPSFSIADSDDEDDAASIASDESLSSPSRKVGPTDAVARPTLPSIAIPEPPTAFDVDSVTSPIDRHSRSLTLEEGEVFRKGTALGAADVDDEELDEVSGEELRKEILETEVQRNPRPLSLVSSEPASSSPVEDDSLLTSST